jgi:hypothetical protein
MDMGNSSPMNMTMGQSMVLSANGERSFIDISHGHHGRDILGFVDTEDLSGILWHMDVYFLPGSHFTGFIGVESNFGGILVAKTYFDDSGCEY